MDWRDEGVLLSVRKHGETAVIASLLTRERGRHLGLVHGGQSRRRQGLLQPGNLVAAHWRARLAEQLGTLTLEPAHDFAASVLDDPARLKALGAATALIDGAVAERDPHPRLYAETLRLLAALEEPGAPGDGAAGGGAAPVWAADYVRWELALLTCLGFGLDLSCCAATGATRDLAYVSPRTGRAVSREAGAPWHGKLLALPQFLLDAGGGMPPGREDIAAGLRLTGYFLERHHFAAEGRRPPDARGRLMAALAR